MRIEELTASFQQWLATQDSGETVDLRVAFINFASDKSLHVTSGMQQEVIAKITENNTSEPDIA